MLKTSFRFLLIFVSCIFLTAQLVSSETPVTDSVVPIIENIESAPSNKYSERHFLEIKQLLSKNPEKIRVVTFNVLFNLFDHSLSDKTHSWNERFPRVVASINNMNPDILCVQEPYPSQLQDLKEALSNTFDCFIGESKTSELNAIFYKKERFELDTKKYTCDSQDLSSRSLHMPLNPKDDELVAKIPGLLPPELEPGKQLTLVHLIDKLTTKSFAVINTHLTYYRVNSREDQAYFIADLATKLHTLKIPVILAGDFNTIPNRPDVNKLSFLDGNHIGQIFQTVLNDTNEIAMLGHVGPLSTFTKDFLKPGSKIFEDTGTPGIVLDHIYVSKDISVIINATEPSRVDGYMPSDHMPVIADIILP
jgi:endonuclease/exonuclease/phosphatase family metal-dependent hydrolase